MACKPPLSCDLSGDVFGEKRTTMRCSVTETQKPQGEFILLYWRYLVLQHITSNTSLKICSWICARKLVWHKFIHLIAKEPRRFNTVLKAVGLENCQVKSVTDRASDKSIESYSTRTTIELQFDSSAIVSRFLTQQNSVQPVLTAVQPQATSSFSATSSSAIHQQQTSQVH